MFFQQPQLHRACFQGSTRGKCEDEQEHGQGFEHLFLGGQLKHGVEAGQDHVVFELDQRLDQLKPAAEALADDLGNDESQGHAQTGHLQVRLKLT